MFVDYILGIYMRRQTICTVSINKRHGAETTQGKLTLEIFAQKNETYLHAYP